MRRILPSIVKILISAALLYFSLRGIDFATLRPRLGQINPLWIAVSTLAIMAMIWISTIRWCDLSLRSGQDLGLRKAWRYMLIGMFFNQTLPSAIGGDAVRLWLMGRDGGNWRAASYAVFVDRAVGMIALSLLASISIPFTFELITDGRARLSLMLIAAVFIGAGLVFLLLAHLPRLRFDSWPPFFHARACSALANQALFNRDSGPGIITISFMVHILTIGAAWAAAKSIGSSVSFVQLLLLMPPIMLILVLPISMAGWGLREAAMLTAFQHAGLPTDDGVLTSLLFGGVLLLVGAFGGLVWIREPRRGSLAT